MILKKEEGKINIFQLKNEIIKIALGYKKYLQDYRKELNDLLEDLKKKISSLSIKTQSFYNDFESIIDKSNKSFNLIDNIKYQNFYRKLFDIDSYEDRIQQNNNRYLENIIVVNESIIPHYQNESQEFEEEEEEEFEEEKEEEFEEEEKEEEFEEEEVCIIDFIRLDNDITKINNDINEIKKNIPNPHSINNEINDFRTLMNNLEKSITQKILNKKISKIDISDPIREWNKLESKFRNLGSSYNYGNPLILEILKEIDKMRDDYYTFIRDIKSYIKKIEIPNSL